MVWSKIKKAINSTLGTSGFKPLDKIVEDSFSEVVARQNEFKDALETGNNNFIVNFANKSANIETGAYTGTGTVGKDNKNRLTFIFTPEIVIIPHNEFAGATLIMVRGQEVARYIYSESSSHYSSTKIMVSWEDNSVSWYSTERVTSAPTYQFNKSGSTYYYRAITTLSGS